MVNKVRVYGKAQNRTALGIVNAYHVLNPNAAFEDFERAFPKDLNPDSGWPVNFKRLEEIRTDNDRNFWFTAADEILMLKDGTKMVVVKMWTKPSFDRLTEHAKQYGIEVAEFEKGMKGEKGGYRLEYLNGFQPVVPVVTKEKRKPSLLWVILGFLLIALLLFFSYSLWRMILSKPEVREVEKTVIVSDTVIVRDTVYMEQIKEIQTDFNAAKFEQGQAALNEEAKFVLHDLAKLLEQNPDVRLKVEGHTSAEGDSLHNIELSKQRAKATVDFLVSQGVDVSRLSWEGKGSSEPKNPANPTAEENRRTEFIIIK